MSAAPSPTPTPLHVLVAQALGWTELSLVRDERSRDAWIWRGNNPDRRGPRWRGARVPLYDKDWGAMGPVIEKYLIALTTNGEYWYASSGDGCPHIGRGAGFAPCADESREPLVSACHALLELHGREVR